MSGELLCVNLVDMIPTYRLARWLGLKVVDHALADFSCSASMVVCSCERLSY